jgi:hypothetical protein
MYRNGEPNENRNGKLVNEEVEIFKKLEKEKGR